MHLLVLSLCSLCPLASASLLREVADEAAVGANFWKTLANVLQRIVQLQL